MNAVKRAVNRSCTFSGVKKVLLLVVSAFVFALPFMTKSLVSYPAVGGFSAIFGWCGLSALFINILGSEKTLKRVLCSLFCFFFAFYFFVYSWFVNLYPMDFAGLGDAESLLVIATAVILIPLIHSCIMTVCVFAGCAAAKRVKNNVLKAAALGCGYVLGEFAQSLGTFAFPWARLFVGQTVFPELLQTASLFGSYFVAFVMVFVNALLALWLLGTVTGEKRVICIVIAVSVFVFNLGFGVVRVHFSDLSDCEKISAVVLQGNIPSGEKWSGEVDEKEIYLDLAEKAENFSADVAVMPETAFPVTLYPDDGYMTKYESALVEISDILDAELFAGAFSVHDASRFNSIFVVSSDGEFSGTYDKYNIVPFGEFLPYRKIIERFFPVFEEINMLSSDLSRGQNFEPLDTDEGKAACLVCFDSIFPETARRQVKNGGEFIIIATNDSWYKTSAAIYQHADHAIMRAIENNVPVIRCANTGISQIIDCRGRVTAKTHVNERTVLNGTVYLPGKMTLYTRIGDVFVAFCAIALVLTFLSGKNKKPGP